MPKTSKLNHNTNHIYKLRFAHLTELKSTHSPLVASAVTVFNMRLN